MNPRQPLESEAMSLKGWFLALALSFLFTPGLRAQDETEPVIEYVWVKGRLSEMARESQSVVTIGGDEIQSLPVRDLVDLLALLPGVHLSRKGPMGAAFDISLRGGNFEQTLILIDGVPWNNPQTGHFNADLPLGPQDIASIQLIRGGNGARYGSAFAGAVNLVTRRKRGLSAKLSGGQYGLFSADLSGGVSLADGLKLSLGIQRHGSDGFHPGREVRNLALNASLRWERKNMVLDAHAGYCGKEFGAAGFYAPLPSQEESDAGFFNLKWSLKGAGGTVPLRVTLSRQTHDDYFELDRTRPEYFSNRSRTGRLLLMAESRFRVRRHELSVGFDLGLDRMDSLAMGKRRENTADLYVNGKWGGEVLTFDWGGRTEFWRGHSPGLLYYTGLSWHPSSLWLIRASLGRSTRRPSFTERFYHSPTNIGEDGLEPELSHNYEISLISPRRYGVFEFSLFHRRQNRTIDWLDRDPAESVLWQAVNLAPFSVSGVELAYSLELGNSRLSLGVERSWSRGAPGVGYATKYGFWIPDLVLRAQGLSSLGRRCSLSWSYQFKRMMAGSESAHLLDVSLQFRLSGRWSLMVLGQNLGNELMEEIDGVKMAGRWLSVGLSYRH